MNCPNCNYPDGPKQHDHYKGLYTPGEKCSGCNFQDTTHPTSILNEIRGYTGSISIGLKYALTEKLSVLELQLLRDLIKTSADRGYQQGIEAAGGRLGV